MSIARFVEPLSSLTAESGNSHFCILVCETGALKGKWDRRGVMTGQRITLGLNLFQPWASAVVEGRVPVLARQFPTYFRGRIAIVATSGIDGVFLFVLNDDELRVAERYFRFSCILGSVVIEDCTQTTRSRVLEDIRKLKGRRAASFYPKHLIPKQDKHGRVYLWIFRDPVRLAKPIRHRVASIKWSRLDLTNSQDKLLKHRPRRLGKSFWG